VKGKSWIAYSFNTRKETCSVIELKIELRLLNKNFLIMLMNNERSALRYYSMKTVLVLIISKPFAITRIYKVF
jgi:hypothetical protein